MVMKSENVKTILSMDVDSIHSVMGANKFKIKFKFKYVYYISCNVFTMSNSIINCNDVNQGHFTILTCFVKQYLKYNI